MKVRGRCHCGEITYKAEVRAGIPAPAEGFRILTGTPRKYLKVADSGARRVHAFCATCGSPVYSCAEHGPKSYTLRIGALSEPDSLGRPARQIWTKRRLSWMPKLEGVAENEGQP
jgi:hypothetical protein